MLTFLCADTLPGAVPITHAPQLCVVGCKLMPGKAGVAGVAGLVGLPGVAGVAGMAGMV